MAKDTDRIVDRFDYVRMTRQLAFPVITVYKNPADYPDKFVARAFDIHRPTDLVAIADTYEELLKAIPDQIMVRVDRSEEDDPVIVEIWI